jgi:hypothetical protein
VIGTIAHLRFCLRLLEHAKVKVKWRATAVNENEGKDLDEHNENDKAALERVAPLLPSSPPSLFLS